MKVTQRERRLTTCLIIISMLALLLVLGGCTQKAKTSPLRHYIEDIAINGCNYTEVEIYNKREIVKVKCAPDTNAGR